MIVLGIDPGYATMGWGLVEYKGSSFKAIDYGAIITDAKMPMEDRLLKIYNDLVAIIDNHNPQAVSIEELFFNTNSKTAIYVSQARGVAILAASIKGLSFFEYTPLQIKQALTGFGRADKNQVQHMVKTILGLRTVPRPDDTADALAAAVCHCHSNGRNYNLRSEAFL